MHNKQYDSSKLAIQKKQENNNARAEAGNLFKLSENQKQTDIYESRSMVDTLVKFPKIETSLAQQEAGIRVKNAIKKTLLAEQATCKALRDEQYWTSTRLTTMKNRSRTFSEGHDLLENWCDFARRMFLDRQHLLHKLHDPMKLTLA